MFDKAMSRSVIAAVVGMCVVHAIITLCVIYHAVKRITITKTNCTSYASENKSCHEDTCKVLCQLRQEICSPCNQCTRYVMLDPSCTTKRVRNLTHVWQANHLHGYNDILLNTHRRCRGQKHSNYKIYVHEKNKTGVLYNIKKLCDTLLPSSVSDMVTLVCALCLYVQRLHHMLTTKPSPVIKVKVLRSSKSFRRKYNRDIPGYLFKFRMKGSYYRQTILVWPFSVNQYATEMVRDNPPAEALMKYEWARYLSFKTFPQESAMTPMRLAQAGFYYTGQAEQVTCFCCGATYGRWSTEESAWQVHERISPTCAFINGEGTDNVTIHASEYYSREYLPNVASLQIGGAGNSSGASGGPADTQSQTSERANLDTQRTASRSSENNTQTSGVETTVSHPEGHASRGAQTETTVAGSQAKHPHYENIETRRGSFATWTLHDIQNPDAMVETGFFYTGVRDFVRCFYCGIGLKNWERQDSPRGEHVHWSPTCAFLQNTESHVTGQNNEAMSTGTTQSGSSNSTTVTTPSTSPAPEPSPSESATRQSSRSRDSSPAVSGETSGGEEAGNREAENAVANENSHEDNTTQNATGGSDKPADRKQLLDENRSLRSQMTCKICLDRESNTVFLPCGHMVACRQCAQSLRKCAVCRKLIKGSVNVYQS